MEIIRHKGAFLSQPKKSFCTWVRSYAHNSSPHRISRDPQDLHRLLTGTDPVRLIRDRLGDPT